MSKPSSSTDQAQLKPPGLLKLALEGRAFWELGASLAAWPLLKQVVKGDQHPVIVFPGLLAADFSTLPLRKFLQDIGYHTHAWEQGINYGPRPGVLETASKLVQSLYEQHQTQVSLVGWSLGGIYARELAKLNPGKVRCVVSMGSPFEGHPRATNAWRLYQLANKKIELDEYELEQLKVAPKVPTTSIYSRSDGVVAWQCSVQTVPAHQSENIEIVASHFGIGLNALAWYAVADRLAQNPHRWKPFARSGLRKHLYGDAPKVARA
jgi:pimeloyl-ACP methyl ester carboxylesterase